MVGLALRQTKQVYVLIACHNRRPLTVNAVKSVLAATEAAGVKAQIVVYDDGSSDGTAKSVLMVAPDAQILYGDGSDFWAKSMAMAEDFILNNLKPQQEDLLLWLNDDVDLRRDALERMIRTHELHPGAIVVGAVCDPDTAALTYSGFRRYGRHALHLGKVSPTSTPQRVDSFNGNVVLVPVPVAIRLGGIDGSYSHAWADLDYGFRCQQANIPMYLSPDFAGTCPGNEPKPQRSLFLEWNEFLGPKGPGNLRSLQRILQRQSKFLWMPQFIATYILWWARAVPRRLVSRRKA